MNEKHFLSSADASRGGLTVSEFLMRLIRMAQVGAAGGREAEKTIGGCLMGHTGFDGSVRWRYEQST